MFTFIVKMCHLLVPKSEVLSIFFATRFQRKHTFTEKQINSNNGSHAKYVINEKKTFKSWSKAENEQYPNSIWKEISTWSCVANIGARKQESIAVVSKYCENGKKSCSDSHFLRFLLFSFASYAVSFPAYEKNDLFLASQFSHFVSKTFETNAVQ